MNHTFFTTTFLPWELKNLGNLNAGKGYLRAGHGAYHMEVNKCIIRVIPVNGFKHTRNYVKRMGKLINKRNKEDFYKTYKLISYLSK